MWRNTNFGGILSLVLRLGTLAIRPQECCWSYPKTFEFRKRISSEYKTNNGYRNEFWKDLEKDQCSKIPSWLFLASRAKAVDNQAARQKKSYFYQKNFKRKKINTLPDLCTYVHFWRNDLQGKLERHKIGTGLFQFGFLLKSQDIYQFGSEFFILFYLFLLKNILQFKLLMKICFPLNFWGFFQHLVLEVNLRIN